MAKKKQSDEQDPVTEQMANDQLQETGEQTSQAGMTTESQEDATEPDTVAYIPHLQDDGIGAGHCKATVTKRNDDGTVDLTVHGPNGDFEVRAVDKGSRQRSYYEPEEEEDATS